MKKHTEPPAHPLCPSCKEELDTVTLAKRPLQSSTGGFLVMETSCAKCYVLLGWQIIGDLPPTIHSGAGLIIRQ